MLRPIPNRAERPTSPAAVLQVFELKTPDGRTFAWNSTLGLALAKARGQVYTFSLAEAGVTAEWVRSQYPDMDEEYALTTDLSEPLLLVPLEGRDQLIDGWHRLFRAAAQGIDVLFAYILTEEEADAIRVPTPCRAPRT